MNFKKRVKTREERLMKLKNIIEMERKRNLELVLKAVYRLADNSFFYFTTYLLLFLLPFKK
jgi:hypothetical protein